MRRRESDWKKRPQKLRKFKKSWIVSRNWRDKPKRRKLNAKDKLRLSKRESGKKLRPGEKRNTKSARD